MRRIPKIVCVQKPLYLETVSGYETHVKLENDIVFCYYKDKKDYIIVLGMNGAILGREKTIKKVEERILILAQEIDNAILNGDINVASEYEGAKQKPLYSEWVELGNSIKREIGVDISFAIIGNEISYLRLEQYLRDNQDFNDMMNAGYDINDAITECFGNDVHKMICKFTGMERIKNNGL